jgi:hypothetical protein
MKLLKFMVILQICLLPFAAASPQLITSAAQFSVMDAFGTVTKINSIVKIIFDIFKNPKDQTIDYTNQIRSISNKVRISKIVN